MPRLVPDVVPAGRLRDQQQPVLTAADGVTLRPWRRADAPALLDAHADAEIQRWHRRRLDSLAEAEQLIAAWAQAWDAETGGTWAIVAGEPAAVAGRLSLRVRLADGIGECGYWVLPWARGAGLATAALTALTSWALADLGLHRMELVHSTANQASCRVAEKAGYQLEGTLRVAMLHLDGWHDMHLHAAITGQAGESAA